MTAEENEIVARLAGSRLLLMLDIDGTLCEIVERPSDARVPPETRETIASLARIPDVSVAFVTGRAIADARGMIDVPGATYIGNHGLERAGPDVRVVPGADDAQTALRAAVADLRAVADSFPGVSLEDKGMSLSIHFRAADASVAQPLERRVAEVASVRGLRVTRGKKVLNVLPDLDVGKGAATVELAASFRAAGRGSILFAGDDVTDEDAFAALRGSPDVVTVHIGAAETAAELSLPDVASLARVLGALRRSRAA